MTLLIYMYYSTENMMHSINNKHAHGMFGGGHHAAIISRKTHHRYNYNSESFVQLITRANKKSNRRISLGFVEEDNGGKSNIFAVEPKVLYTSSPRADQAARQGLGGQQGLSIVLGLSLLVGVATVMVFFQQQANTIMPASTLQEIAARL